jgi:hypothetical protein
VEDEGEEEVEEEEDEDEEEKEDEKEEEGGDEDVEMEPLPLAANRESEEMVAEDGEERGMIEDIVANLKWELSSKALNVRI